MTTSTDTPRYAGADWLRKTARVEVSPLGAVVADILGDLFGGLYHLSQEVRETKWSDPWCIEVRLKGFGFTFSTFDGGTLTNLVFLAHDRCVRIEISPMSRSSLLLRFHQRKRIGGMGQRHPTLEQAVTEHRRYWPEE